MALTKKTPAPTPTFESEDPNPNAAETQTVAAAPVVEQVQVASPADKVAATTAIAKAQTSAIAATGKNKFSAALTHLEYQLELEHVKALGVGTLPKMSADRAGFEIGEGKDKLEYGEWVDFNIFSYNKRWLASTGEDGEDAKPFLRTSYDNETLEGEVMSLKDYVQYLKDEGHAKASARMYIDVWGFVVNSDKLGLVEEEDREMIQLQLSPVSVKQFTAYQLQAGIKASLSGKVTSDTVRATIDKKEFNGNKFAAMKFAAA